MKVVSIIRCIPAILAQTAASSVHASTPTSLLGLVLNSRLSHVFSSARHFGKLQLHTGAKGENLSFQYSLPSPYYSHLSFYGDVFQKHFQGEWRRGFKGQSCFLLPSRFALGTQWREGAGLEGCLILGMADGLWSGNLELSVNCAQGFGLGFNIDMAASPKFSAELGLVSFARRVSENQLKAKASKEIDALMGSTEDAVKGIDILPYVAKATVTSHEDRKGEQFSLIGAYKRENAIGALRKITEENKEAYLRAFSLFILNAHMIFDCFKAHDPNFDDVLTSQKPHNFFVTFETRLNEFLKSKITEKTRFFLNRSMQIFTKTLLHLLAVPTDLEEEEGNYFLHLRENLRECFGTVPQESLEMQFRNLAKERLIAYLKKSNIEISDLDEAKEFALEKQITSELEAAFFFRANRRSNKREDLRAQNPEEFSIDKLWMNLFFRLHFRMLSIFTHPQVEFNWSWENGIEKEIDEQTREKIKESVQEKSQELEKDLTEQLSNVQDVLSLLRAVDALFSLKSFFIPEKLAVEEGPVRKESVHKASKEEPVGKESVQEASKEEPVEEESVHETSVNAVIDHFFFYEEMSPDAFIQDLRPDFTVYRGLAEPRFHAWLLSISERYKKQKQEQKEKAWKERQLASQASATAPSIRALNLPLHLHTRANRLQAQRSYVQRPAVCSRPPLSLATPDRKGSQGFGTPPTSAPLTTVDKS